MWFNHIENTTIENGQRQFWNFTASSKPDGFWSQARSSKMPIWAKSSLVSHSFIPWLFPRSLKLRAGVSSKTRPLITIIASLFPFFGRANLSHLKFPQFESENPRNLPSLRINSCRAAHSLLTLRENPAIDKLEEPTGNAFLRSSRLESPSLWSYRDWWNWATWPPRQAN